MKYSPIFISFFSLALILSPFSAKGQFIKDLKKRAEESAKQTVERKTEEKTAEKTEQAIDSLFNLKIKKKAPGDHSDQNDPGNDSGQFEDIQYETGYEGSTKQVAPLQSYSKFDFIMGSDIRFAEDFSDDPLGDLPDGWLTSSTLEVVELNSYPGKWVKIGKGKTGFTPQGIGALPQDFTMEFDIVLDIDAQKFAPATRFFGVVLNDLKASSIELGNWRAGSNMIFLGFSGDAKYMAKRWKQSEFNDLVKDPLGLLSKENLQRGDLIRVSVWKSKHRIRLYFNEEKVFDVVQAEPETSGFSSLKFYADNANEGDFFYISNIRMADAPPAIARELSENGLLEAMGIYFETGSDQLKPESYPTLKAIADFMIQSGSSFTIAGHTDNVGEKEANRLLSESRASAVRQTLVKTYGVDTNQLASIGFGARYPVYSNDTPEGRAKNRRVDIINLSVYTDYENKLMEKVYGEGRK